MDPNLTLTLPPLTLTLALALAAGARQAVALAKRDVTSCLMPAYGARWRSGKSFRDQLAGPQDSGCCALLINVVSNARSYRSVHLRSRPEKPTAFS